METDINQRPRGRWLRDLAYLPALLAALVLAYFFNSAEKAERLKFQQQMREAIFSEADKSRLQLSLQLNTQAMLVRGMVASFAANPAMSQEQFEGLAKALLEQGELLRYVAAAPNMVLSMIYPPNWEDALGEDMRDMPQHEPGFVQTIERDGLSLQGPFQHQKEGRIVEIRVPVMEYDDPGTRHMWGVVAAVVDFDQLLAAAGLNQPNGKIRTALFTGSPDNILPQNNIFGDTEILNENPVLLEMQLPGLDWTLAAVPAEAWPIPPRLFFIRSGFTILAFLALVPLVISAQLYRENFDHLETLKGREMELRAIWRRYRLALDASDVGVWDYDLDKRHLRADRRLRELLGGSGALPGGDLSAAMVNVPKAARETLLAGICAALEKGQEYRATFPVRAENGTTRHLRMIAAPARVRQFTAKTGALKQGQVIGLCWDVTSDVLRQQGLEQAQEQLIRRNEALEKAHARIEEAALTDPLTGLANRRRFEQMRQDRADLADPLANVDGMLLLDLDGFKEVNDRLGHPTGDQLLIRVGEVLREASGPDDLVARIGGDEFAVLLQGGQRSAASITALARSIATDIRTASRELGATQSTGCSVGLARPGTGGQRMAELFASADYALYRAKQQKTSKLAEYTPTLDRQRKQSAQRSRELRAAVLTRQFEVCYQPRYSMRDMSVARLEALVRWRHPERGLLTPGEFMQDLVDMGLAVRIDRYVLEQVVEDLASWEQTGLHVGSVSVNISSQRLADESLLSDLSRLGPARERLVLELLEAINFSSDGGELIDNVNRLRDMGIALEVDDFGTGHSSPLNMLRLRPEGIKIARELVAPITHSEESRTLVSALVGLGRSLGMRVTAEGVETDAHIEVLSHMGLDELQGFALGRPMSFVQIAQDAAVREAFGVNKVAAS